MGGLKPRRSGVLVASRRWLAGGQFNQFAMKIMLTTFLGRTLLLAGIPIYLVLFALPAVADQSRSAIDYKSINWSQISSNELDAIVKKADPSRIPPQDWGGILKRVDWFQLPAKVQRYVSDNVDWSMVPTNIILFYNKPAAWPNCRQTLEHCAELMHSSVDTNSLSLSASILTNVPEILEYTNRLSDGSETVLRLTNSDLIQYFEDFSNRVESTLNEYAGYLTNPKLNAYHGQAGYEAEIHSSKQDEGMIDYLFYKSTGPTVEIRRLTEGVSRARSRVVFYESGKLALFDAFTDQHQETVYFGENGQLHEVMWVINDKFALEVNLDAFGKPHYKCYSLRIPLHK